MTDIPNKIRGKGSGPETGFFQILCRVTREPLQPCNADVLVQTTSKLNALKLHPFGSVPSACTPAGAHICMRTHAGVHVLAHAYTCNMRMQKQAHENPTCGVCMHVCVCALVRTVNFAEARVRTLVHKRGRRT